MEKPNNHPQEENKNQQNQVSNILRPKRVKKDCGCKKKRNK